MFYRLYNLGKSVEYQYDSHTAQVTTVPIPDDTLIILNSSITKSPIPLQPTYTVAIDNFYPGFSFTFTRPISTIAELVNEWNVQAVKFQKHCFSLEPDFHDNNYVYITNNSLNDMHVWCGSFSYLGMWKVQETKRFLISEFILSDTFLLSSHPSPSPSIPSPIVISQDTHVFDFTAYLYRRNDKGFYTKTESVIIPAGFYANIYDFVAVLNTRIFMRGERNGFIYNFIVSGDMKIGIEASHRQPEPSVLQVSNVTSLAYLIGMCDSMMSLPLRTSKRIHFTGHVAGAM